MDSSENIFLSLFCLEMVIKIIAMGFFVHRESYLRDSWNRLDFTVVILGIIAAMNLGNFSAIRTVRVLRPLRTLQGFAGMRQLVVTLLNSLPLLGDVAVLMAFLFFLLGLIGVQLFSGALNRRCASLDNPNAGCELCGYDVGYLGYNASQISAGCLSDCALPASPRWTVDDATTCGGPRESKYPGLGAKPSGYRCPEGSWCIRHDAPNHGITSFDNILGAWLAIFQCISMEGWVDIMYWTQDAVSEYSSWYFVVTIILGSFFAINLALAVLYVSFTTERKTDKEQHSDELAAEKEANSKILATMESETSYQAAQMADMQRRLSDASPGRKSAPPSPSMSPHASFVATPPNGGSIPEEGETETGTFGDGDSDAETPTSNNGGDVPVKRPSVFDSAFRPEKFGSAMVTPLPMRTVDEDGGDGDFAEQPWLNEGFTTVQQWVKHHGGEIQDVQIVNGIPVVVRPSLAQRFQRTCRVLAMSATVGKVTMFLIILNTVLMASEFHGMSRGQVDAYEGINYFVTAYFALEMVAKIIGLKPRAYVADRFNIFDGVVVIISIIELAIADGGGGGNLTVLRSFRLLRILKLARSWPQLRKIIATILDTIPSMSSLAGMLFLFIFIFDLLGLQLFGYEFVFCDSYDVEGAAPSCPPNVLETSCPNRKDCYVGCESAQADTWIAYDSGATGYCAKYGDGSYLARLGESDQPRHHFDDFFWAFITIFQVLTGENWNEVMYDGMRTKGNAACLYFILLVVIGNYIVLNLFLAILLDNFADMDSSGETATETAAREAKKAEELQRKKSQALERRKTRQAEWMKLQAQASLISGGSFGLGRSKSLGKEGAEGVAGGDEHFSLVARARVQAKHLIMHPKFDQCVIFLICVSSVLLAVDSPNIDPDSQLKKALNITDVVFVTVFTLEALVKMFALGMKRYFAVGWNVMDFVIVVIGLIGAILELSGSSTMQAARSMRSFRALRPMRMASRAEGMRIVIEALFQAIPPIMNVALVCILFYLIFGILGLNLFMGKLYRCVYAGTDDVLISPMLGMNPKDVTRAWCDVGTHLVGCVGGARVALYSSGQLGWTCVSSTIPTSVVNADANRVETYSGEWTCTATAETRAVLTADPYDFGSYGVRSSYVDGTIGADGYDSAAVDAAVETAVSSGTFTSTCEPRLEGHEWRKPENYDFDNIGASMLVLFETATLEMWLEVMYHSVDAVEEGTQPRLNHNEGAALFYVVFIIIGAFFVMNLFVGVTIDKFNEMKETQEEEDEIEGRAKGASLFVTEEQRRWQLVERMMSKCKPTRVYEPPKHAARARVFHVVTNPAFDVFIMVCILANVIVMCLSYADEPDQWTIDLFIANSFFTFVFMCEVIAKITALGPRAYMEDPWNRFDFTVVGFSLIGFIVTVSTDASAGFIAMLRVLRVARVLRLVRRARGLRTLLQTLLFSLPALVNVGSVLFLFFFIFAIMGMNLYGKVKKADHLTRHANFDYFPNSMLTLFRSSTGEMWNGIMHDCMVYRNCYEIQVGEYAGTYVEKEDSRLDGLPLGDDGYEDRCTPSYVGTIAYFVLFILICGFVMLNLVIAVILDNFQSYSGNVDLPVSEEDFTQFALEWGRIDRSGSYYIPADKLPKLLRRLSAPLGVKNLPKAMIKKALILTLFTCNVRIEDGKVHFSSVLKALAARLDGIEPPPEPPRRKRRGSVGSVMSEDEESLFSNPFGEDDQVKHLYAAIHVQSAWRRKEAMRRVQLAKIRARKQKGSAGAAALAQAEKTERRLLKSTSMTSDKSTTSTGSG